MFLHIVLFISGVLQLWFTLGVTGGYPRNQTGSSPFEEIYHIEKVFNQLRRQMKGTKVSTQQERRNSDLASQKLEELRLFFEKVKLMTAAPRPTTDKASAPPSVRNPIKMIFTRVGVGFRYTIAHDTFYDSTDGDALSLNLDLLTNDRNKLFPNSWIKLDKQKLEIYGFPLMGNKGKFTYHLKATNKRGKSSYNTFLAYVYANFEFYNHDLVICTSMSFSTFARDVDKRIELVDKIAKYVLGTELENVWVRKFEKGCLSTTFKHLPARGRCNHKAIETIEETVFLEGKVHPKFIKALQSVTDVKAVNLTLTGACAKKTSSEDAEELEWLKALAPVIILVGIVAIPTCVSCLVCREVRRRQARMRQLQDKKLKEDHATMLVQAQEYKRECGLDEDSDDGLDPHNPKKVRFSDLHEEDGPLLGKIAEMILPEAFVDTVNKGSELLGMIMPATTSANQDASGISVVTESVPSSRRPSRNPLSHFLDISNPRNEVTMSTAPEFAAVTASKSSRGLVDVLRNPLEITTPATERANTRSKHDPLNDFCDSGVPVTTKSGLLSGIKNFFTPAITVTPKSPSTESVAVTTTSSSIGSRIALLLNPWTSFSSEDQQIEHMNVLALDSMEELDRLENDYAMESFNQSQESGCEGVYARSLGSSIAETQSLNASRCQTPIKNNKGFFTSIKDIFSLVNTSNDSDEKGRDCDLEMGDDAMVVKSSTHLTPQGSLCDPAVLRYRRYSATLPYLQPVKGFKPPNLAQIRAGTIRQLKKLDKRGSLSQLYGVGRGRKKSDSGRDNRNGKKTKGPPGKIFLTPDFHRREHLDRNLYFNEMFDAQGLRRWNSCSPEQFPKDNVNDIHLRGTLPRRNSSARRIGESVSERNSLVHEPNEFCPGMYGSEILLHRYDSEDSPLNRIHQTDRGSMGPNAMFYPESSTARRRSSYKDIQSQYSGESQGSSYKFGTNDSFQRSETCDSASRTTSEQSGYSHQGDTYHGENYQGVNYCIRSFSGDNYQGTAYHNSDYQRNSYHGDVYVRDSYERRSYDRDDSQRSSFVSESYHLDNYDCDNYKKDNYINNNYEEGNYLGNNYINRNYEGDSYNRDNSRMMVDEETSDGYGDAPRTPLIVYSSEYQEAAASVNCVSSNKAHKAGDRQNDVCLREPIMRRSVFKKSMIKQRSFQESISRLEVPDSHLQRRNSLPFEPGSSFDAMVTNEISVLSSRERQSTRSLEIDMSDSELINMDFNYHANPGYTDEGAEASSLLQSGTKQKKPNLCWQPLFSDGQSYPLDTQERSRNQDENPADENSEGRFQARKQSAQSALYPIGSHTSNGSLSASSRRHEFNRRYSDALSTPGLGHCSPVSQDRLSPIQIYNRPDFARMRLGSIGRSKSDPYSAYDDQRQMSPVLGSNHYARSEYDFYPPHTYEGIHQGFSTSFLPTQNVSEKTNYDNMISVSDYDNGNYSQPSDIQIPNYENQRGATMYPRAIRGGAGYIDDDSSENDSYFAPQGPASCCVEHLPSQQSYNYHRFNHCSVGGLDTGSPDVFDTRGAIRLGYVYQQPGQLTASMDTIDSVRGYPDGNSGSPEIDNTSPQPELDAIDRTGAIPRYSRVTRQSTSGSSTSESTRSRRISRGLERQRRVEEDDSGNSSPSVSTAISIHFNPLADLMSLESPEKESDRGYPDGDNASHGPPVRQYTSTKCWQSDLKGETAFQRLALRRSVYGKSASADERFPEDRQLTQMRSLSMDLDVPYIGDEVAFLHSVPNLTNIMMQSHMHGRKDKTPPSTTPDRKGSGGERSKHSSPSSRLSTGRKHKVPTIESRGSSLVESNYYDAAGEFIQGNEEASGSYLSDFTSSGMRGHVVHAGKFVTSVTGRREPFSRQSKKFSKPGVFKHIKPKADDGKEGQFMGSLFHRFGEGNLVSRFHSKIGGKDKKPKRGMHLQTLNPLETEAQNVDTENVPCESIRYKLSTLSGPK